MEYAKLYPNVKKGFIIHEVGLLVSEEPAPCMVCGTPTKFVDVCSEGRICSEECNEEFYEKVEDQFTKGTVL